MYRINLPPGMKVSNLPDKFSLDSEFGKLEIQYSMDGTVLVAKQTMTYTTSRIPPEKYPAFRDFINQSLRQEELRLAVGKS